MPFYLDMRTLFVTLVIGHFFTAVLISAYWKEHDNEPALDHFLIAKCLHAMAWLLLALRGGIPDVLTISLANTMLFVGNAYETIAILKVKGHYTFSVKQLYIYLTIGLIAAFHIVMLTANIESHRIAVASIGTVSMIVLPTFYLLTEKNASVLSRLMGYIYGLIILSFSIRTGMALMSESQMGLFTQSGVQSFSLLTVFFVMFSTNTGFILLLKEKADEELMRLASYDDLTASMNRRTFIRHGTQTLQTYARKKEPVSYLLFDIDFFKLINDQYGHEVGDRILQDMSEKIRSLLVSNQLFGRYGGDEFAILLPGMDPDEAFSAAEMIRLTILNPIKKELPVYNVSIGLVTIVPDGSTQMSQLYIESDKALYTAKANGKNCVYARNLDTEPEISGVAS
ncbi:GGDEF domain-containing protein [Alkalibacterium indicireducens]|uniref:GGDEF domain-containing protein n=2 Tax=Alkalibacterium indicireducens TaxID=398758 RepID=A0ABP3L728_9LACT